MFNSAVSCVCVGVISWLKTKMLLLVLGTTTNIGSAKVFCRKNAYGDHNYRYRNGEVGTRQLTAATTSVSLFPGFLTSRKTENFLKISRESRNSSGFGKFSRD